MLLAAEVAHGGMQMSGVLEGVELGQFIMTTQRGRLFRGVYNGDPVTVKVSQYLPCWSHTESLRIACYILQLCLMYGITVKANAAAHLAILCACFL